MLEVIELIVVDFENLRLMFLFYIFLLLFLVILYVFFGEPTVDFLEFIVYINQLEYS